MKIDRLDHLVLTVASIDATVDFYKRALGFSAVKFGQGRTALAFGDQKINLHQAGAEFEPKAKRPTPGSGDFCFTTETPIAEVAAHLRQANVEIIEGPVAKTGARSALISCIFSRPRRQSGRGQQ